MRETHILRNQTCKRVFEHIHRGIEQHFTAYNNQCFDQQKPASTTKKRQILDYAFRERTDPDVEDGEQQRVYKTTVDDRRHRRCCNNGLPFQNGEKMLIRKEINRCSRTTIKQDVSADDGAQL